MSDKPILITYHEIPKREPCEHEWPQHRSVRDDDVCLKCGMSFIEYYHTISSFNED
jgi:hypothetical protein